MDPAGWLVFTVGAPIAALAAFGWLSRRLARRREIPVEASPVSTAPSNALVSAARGLRLAVDERDGRWRANGAIDGVRVDISLHPVVIVEARLAIPNAVSIVPLDSLDYDHDARVDIGDPGFDAAVRVRGRAAWVFAVLDPGTRNTVRERIEKRGVRVRDGTVVWMGDATTSAADLKSAVASAVDVAKLLRLDPAREGSQLAANLSAETHEAVRERIVEALASFPESPDIVDARERALDDRSPRVRLAAARGTRTQKAKEVLGAIASDRELSEELRITAFERYRTRADGDELAAIAGDVLDPGKPDLALAVLHRTENFVLPLAVLLPLADHPDEGIRREVAKRIDASTPEGEAALLARLHDGEEEDILLLVLHTLARTGSVAAIERLRPMTEGLPFVNAERRAAAQATIDAIQDRAKTAPGGLTLAEGDDPRGRLSPAQQAAGAVTIATPKK